MLISFQLFFIQKNFNKKKMATRDELLAARHTATIQLGMARTQCNNLFRPTSGELDRCAKTVRLLEITINHLNFELEHNGSRLTSPFVEDMRKIFFPFE